MSNQGLVEALAAWDRYEPDISQQRLVAQANGMAEAIRLALPTIATLTQDLAEARAAKDELLQDSERSVRAWEALYRIQTIANSGDRVTVNEQNAFKFFSILNRQMIEVRKLADTALSSSARASGEVELSAEPISAERMRIDAANIALAIDSGRGNEKQIAKTIMSLPLTKPEGK